MFEYRLADGTKRLGVRVWRRGIPLTRKGFRTKEEARQWYEDRRRDIREGRSFPDERIDTEPAPAPLLSAIIDDYLQTATLKKNYRGECEYAAYWKMAFQGLLMTEVTPLKIDQIRTHLLHGGETRDPVSPATVNRYVAWLHHLYNWSIDREICQTNPCRLFVRSHKKGGQKFAEAPAPDHVWSDDDLRLLVRELGEHILVPLFALLSGLRQREQFELRKDRIDWQRGCAYLDDPKAGTSQVVYFNADALRILRYQASKSGASPFVYPSPRWPMDQPMSGKSWYALYFKPAATRAGLVIGRAKGKTWHTLRHSFADRLLDLKVHIKDVQGAGRWESMQAMTRYLKKRQERVAAGVALLQSPIPLDTLIGTDTGTDTLPTLAGIGDEEHFVSN